MNIHEVIALGPIVASDEEAETIIGINGSYLNLFVRHSNGDYENVDCRTWKVPRHPDNEESTLYNTTVSEAMDLAEAWLKELREGPEEDENG